MYVSIKDKDSILYSLYLLTGHINMILGIDIDIDIIYYIKDSLVTIFLWNHGGAAPLLLFIGMIQPHYFLESEQNRTSNPAFIHSLLPWYNSVYFSSLL